MLRELFVRDSIRRQLSDDRHAHRKLQDHRDQSERLNDLHAHQAHKGPSGQKRRRTHALGTNDMKTALVAIWKYAGQLLPAGLLT